MGLHAFIIRMFFAPQTFVYLPKWDPARVAESIQKYQVTSLSMVPSMAHQLATHAKLRKVNLDGILSISTGAAYLPPELRSKLAQRAKNVISLTEGYGMSECVRVYIYSHISFGRLKYSRPWRRSSNPSSSSSRKYSLRQGLPACS